MNKKCFLLCIAFIACLQLFAQRVIIIGLDGFGSEGFKGSKHPNIDKLFDDGVLSLTTRPVMPSVTLPNWTSHLTGSGPEEHGIVNNNWTLQNHELTPIDTDKDGYYPSIFKLLKEQVKNVKTAYYYNWAELINSMNKKYMDEISFQYNDGYDSNYNKVYDFIVKNKQQPEFIFLYSVHTDHAGHEYGWMSPQYITAIGSADSAIGVFIDKLKAADLYNDTYFLLITDHGGKDKGHGGTSMQEMQVPWAITGPTIQKAGLTDFYNSNKNTALVVAKIFGVQSIPQSWTGIVPQEIFK